jgi:GGDEF domain-containing protein
VEKPREDGRGESEPEGLVVDVTEPKTPAACKPGPVPAVGPTPVSFAVPRPKRTRTPAGEPAGEPVSEPAGEPAARPRRRPGRDTVPEPVPMPESVPMPEPEPVPAPEPEPVGLPVSEPTSGPVSIPVPEPDSAPEPVPVPVPVPEPDSEPEPEPVSEPVHGPPVLLVPPPRGREPYTVTEPGPPAPATPAPATPVPATPAPATANKRQKARLTQMITRLAPVRGRLEVAELVVAEAAELVVADTAALVMRSIRGARVMAFVPKTDGDPQLWGMRTLVALLSTSDPVRVVLDGDPLEGGGTTSLLSVPVPSHTGVVGVLVCRRRAAREFTESDEDALTRLARACGDRLHHTVERYGVAASSVDRATGLGGLGLLRHDLASSLAARSEHGLPLALVGVEVVGLSALRSARGANVADVALSRVAARVGSRMRIGDLLYRIGPDELGLLLPATDVSGGRAAATRLGRLGQDVALLGDTSVGGSLRAVALPVEGEVDGLMRTLFLALDRARHH